ncbi:MAG: polysulfide reductase NrfD [Anaerolineae bacterium]|jgi:Ni/Fe-hydrogenase subunit HybB-like protein|nr:polysulfide reductase NrfD [Anaerolineae bacterium]
MGLHALSTQRALSSNERRELTIKWIGGLLALLVLLGGVAGLWRMATGLGATTALTDDIPWGIWIGFDFSLIAFSGAAFTMAGVVYILRRNTYQPALRPAVLTGLLGYTAVLVLLVLDLGRPDRFYHFILFWNAHSPLFEICWCILLYTVVLTVEVSPQVLEKLGHHKWAHRIHLAIVPVAIIAVTLSSLHQSTLGTLYLNMPHRLNALWFTPILPVLFLTSAVMTGLTMGALGYRAACAVTGQQMERRVFAGLARAAGWIAVFYLGIKVGDWIVRGQLPALFAFDYYSKLMWAELALIVGPALLLLLPKLRNDLRSQTAGLLLLAGGVLLNRFNATLFAQVQPNGAIYTPAAAEWLSTLGVIAAAMLAWLLAVRFLTVFEPQKRHAKAEGAPKAS